MPLWIAREAEIRNKGSASGIDMQINDRFILFLHSVTARMAVPRDEDKTLWFVSPLGLQHL